MGTSTNNVLTIGARNEGRMNIHPDGYVLICKEPGDDIKPLNISEANKKKYSLFVLGGVLSEDFAIGAQNTWSDTVFNNLSSV